MEYRHWAYFSALFERGPDKSKKAGAAGLFSDQAYRSSPLVGSEAAGAATDSTVRWVNRAARLCPVEPIVAWGSAGVGSIEGLG